jgi:hypothetical protein
MVFDVDLRSGDQNSSGGLFGESTSLNTASIGAMNIEVIWAGGGGTLEGRDAVDVKVPDWT